MNTYQAKAQPLTEFLQRMGYHPATIRGHDHWYKSPFRPEERTPSFKIDAQKNIWYDHGMGQGGTIIEFVQHLNHSRDIPQTLATIEGILGQTHFPARQQTAYPTVNNENKSTQYPPPTIHRIQTIQSPTLESYLKLRAIPLDLARLHLQEIHYTAKNHSYQALAFANDKGGYEIRNPYFKGTIGKKDISTRQQDQSFHSSQTAVLFEGFFDYLSILAHYKTDQAKTPVIILNSVALLERGIEQIRQLQIQKLHAYLDHDPAGRQALQTLQNLTHEQDTRQDKRDPETKKEWSVIDASTLYKHHKDANEFLT